MLILAILYVLFPLDFIPDFVPILGYGDDIAALLLALLIRFLSHAKEERIKTEILGQARDDKGDNIIDGEIVE
ncbi:hypothetical protein A2716_02780 [candidate division WWE3 bacterium RIFCSPHIGHO2_01_FULL_40_23]|uniref:DUF1232 domain-containing protein n=1 Tax=candidate division WWE3 bacterium RIFCSPLOWO2_01_FULL_41_18 TaxID=1802625 RepID=A0A1F4VG07_UNCKA|nr:MAG: hypothetical protein A2716_02780 [candidate division WWE3 bacterium RIFCSPHIGHO2_01_FULL_40_23]OGC55910.1 MAG: hypothetical protein A3A78_02630 [candidate division WWE3 bacterium RIFCSPLOWO2_01_FULL_41_18]